MNKPRYKVGDQVMFANRVQRTTAGMTVTKVDSVGLINDHRYQLACDTYGVWWVEANLMPLSEWQRKYA